MQYNHQPFQSYYDQNQQSHTFMHLFKQNMVNLDKCKICSFPQSYHHYGVTFPFPVSDTDHAFQPVAVPRETLDTKDQPGYIRCPECNMPVLQSQQTIHRCGSNSSGGNNYAGVSSPGGIIKKPWEI